MVAEPCTAALVSGVDTEQHFATDFRTFCNEFNDILRRVSEHFATDFITFCDGLSGGDTEHHLVHPEFRFLALDL